MPGDTTTLRMPDHYPVEFERVISALNDSRVDYVIVGGIAVVLHGVDRLTADLDLVVDLQPDALLGCFGQARSFGLPPKTTGGDEIARRAGTPTNEISLRCEKDMGDKRDRDDWGSWQQAENWRRESFMTRTPAQRLQWLKSALVMAYRSGALKRAADHREEGRL